jgi:hypothetical protein
MALGSNTASAGVKFHQNSNNNNNNTRRKTHAPKIPLSPTQKETTSQPASQPRGQKTTRLGFARQGFASQNETGIQPGPLENATRSYCNSFSFTTATRRRHTLLLIIIIMLTTKPQWKPPPPAMQKQQRQSLIRLPSDRGEKELLGTYHAALFFLASSSQRSERPPLARLAR